MKKLITVGSILLIMSGIVCFGYGLVALEDEFIKLGLLLGSLGIFVLTCQILIAIFIIINKNRYQILVWLKANHALLLGISSIIFIIILGTIIIGSNATNNENNNIAQTLPTSTPDKNASVLENRPKENNNNATISNTPTNPYSSSAPIYDFASNLFSSAMPSPKLVIGKSYSTKMFSVGGDTLDDYSKAKRLILSGDQEGFTKLCGGYTVAGVHKASRATLLESGSDGNVKILVNGDTLWTSGFVLDADNEDSNTSNYASPPSYSSNASHGDGLLFYDSSRSEPYWANETSHFFSRYNALMALANQYDRTYTWVVDHMGSSNDLSTIHHNLVNQRLKENSE